MTIFRLLSARAGRLARRRGELRKTCRNLRKTQGKHTIRVCRRLRARRENRLKIVPKALVDHVALQIATERRSWALLGRSWALLGRSWALLGRSWGALGRSWDALETLLDAPGTLLGRSLTLLGDLGSIFAPPRVDFGVQESILEPPGMDFEWHRLGHASNLEAPKLSQRQPQRLAY